MYSPRDAICRKCKSSYVNTDRRISLCPECIREEKLARREQRLGISRGGAFAVRIIRDPLKPGGFPGGTIFERREVEIMLEQRSFTPGTVASDMQGSEYIFNGKTFVPQS